MHRFRCDGRTLGRFPVGWLWRLNAMPKSKTLPLARGSPSWPHRVCRVAFLNPLRVRPLAAYPPVSRRSVCRLLVRCLPPSQPLILTRLLVERLLVERLLVERLPRGEVGKN